MQGISNFIPEVSRVSTVYNVAAIRKINVLRFCISTFRSGYAVPSEAVFCSYLMLCFLCIVFRYFLNDFESVPIDPLITGISLVLHSIYFCFCLHFVFFRDHIYISEIPVFIDRHVRFPLSRIMIRSCCEGYFFHFSLIPSIRWLPYFHDFFLLWYVLRPLFLSNFTPISFHKLIVGHTAYHFALCMFLHQYWADWHNVVYCLPILSTSAFVICFCFDYFCCMILVCNAWFAHLKWTDIITNDEVFQKVKEERLLLKI